MARLPCVMGEFKGCCLLAGLYPSMKRLLNVQQLVSYGLGIPTVTRWTFFFFCADAESKINAFKGWVIRRCIDANSKKMLRQQVFFIVQVKVQSEVRPSDANRKVLPWSAFCFFFWGVPC